LERLAGPMFGAAEIIKRQIPGMQFVLPLASPHLRSRLEEIRRQVGCAEEITYVAADIYTCLSRCSLVMTTTGTSTLEAALLEVPMVAAYRVHPISALLGRMFASTRYVALPNLLLEEFVVPEILQREVTAERLAQAALEILQSPARQAAMRARFRELPRMLGEEGVLDRVAELVLDEVAARRQPCLSAT
jgi:lipid-A-disaccharide synthase